MSSSAPAAAAAVNHHATALIAGDRGVLLRGLSGSGKTGLALALVEWCRLNGLFGSLVADDQVLLSRCGGRLVAAVPPSIAGLVEIRGFSPTPARNVSRIVVDLVVDLEDRAEVSRYQAGRTVMLMVETAHLAVERGDIAGAIRAIVARLELPAAWTPACRCANAAI